MWPLGREAPPRRRVLRHLGGCICCRGTLQETRGEGNTPMPEGALPRGTSPLLTEAQKGRGQGHAAQVCVGVGNHAVTPRGTLPAGVEISKPQGPNEGGGCELES